MSCVLWERSGGSAALEGNAASGKPAMPRFGQDRPYRAKIVPFAPRLVLEAVQYL